MKIKKSLKILNKVLLPASNIGGLQITNTSIRFLELKEQGGKIFNMRTASLRLPPGIIESGRVKDRVNLVAALKSIHNQLDTNPNHTINVILTIPTGDVYAQAFSVPAVSNVSLQETADLNMQVISPNPIDKSYYSWMIVGDVSSSGNQVELLGAFVAKEAIHELSSSLEEAGFGIAAIEFSSLSMARILSYYKIIDSKLPYLLVKLTQEGLIFMILRNGNLYFDYFHSWEKLIEEKGSISLDSITSIIYSESTRVLNFYSSKWGGQIKNIILISPTMLDEISKYLSATYPTFSISALSSDKENLHGVRGAAFRALKARSEDLDINLMDPASINGFLRDQVISFIKLWRNIIITISIFILALFVATNIFLGNQATLVREAFNGTQSQSGIEDLSALQARVNSFNSLVDTLNSFKVGSGSPTEIISNILGAASSNIVVSRLVVQIGGKAGNIDGLSKDQNSIIDFKNALSKIPELSEVNLPLSNINTQPSGQVSFTISFKLR